MPTPFRRTAAALTLCIAATTVHAQSAAEPPEPVRIEIERPRDVMLQESFSQLVAIGADGVARQFSLRTGTESLAAPLPETWIASAVVDEGRGVLGVTKAGAVEFMAIVVGAKPMEVVPAEADGPPVRSVDLLASPRGAYAFVRMRPDVESGPREMPPPPRGLLLSIARGGRVEVLRELGDEAPRWAFGGGTEPRLVHMTFEPELVVEDLEGNELARAGRGVLNRDAGLSSPSLARGDRFAAVHAGMNGTVAVLDLASGESVFLEEDLGSGEQTEVPELGPRGVGVTAFVPRSGVLAVAEGGRRRVRLWEYATGRVVHDLPLPGLDPAAVVASPGGKFLAAADESGVSVWAVADLDLPRAPADDAALGAQVVEVLGGSPWRTRGVVRSMSVSPDGKTVVLGGRSGHIEARSVADASVVWTSKLPRGDVMQLLHTPDGTKLVCAPSHEKPVVVDAVTGEVLDQVPHDDALGGMFQNAHCIALSRDGRLLAMGGAKGTVVWDLEKGAGVGFVPSLEAETMPNIKLPVWPIGIYFLEGARPALVATWQDGRSRILSLESARVSDSGEEGRDLRLMTVTISLDGERVATGTHAGNVALSSLASGEGRVAGRDLWVPEEPIQALMPGGRRSIAVPRPGHDEVWWVTTDGRVAVSRNEGEPQLLADVHDGPVMTIAFSRDGATAFTSSTDLTFCRWDVEKLAPGPRPEVSLGAVTSLAWSPDGKTVAIGVQTGGIVLWPVGSKKPARVLDTKGEGVFRVAWSPGSTHVGAILVEQTESLQTAPASHVATWSVANGKRVLAPKLLEMRAPIDVAVTDDGKTAFVGGIPDLLRATAAGVTQVAHGLEDGRPMFTSLRISSDGKYLVATTNGGAQALVVGVAGGKALRVCEPSKLWVNEYDRTPDCVAVGLDAEGKTVLGLLEDGSIAHWTLSTGTPRARGTPGARRIETGIVSADGSAALQIGRSGTAFVRRVEDGAVLGMIPGEGGRQGHPKIALHPSGTEAILPRDDGTLERLRLTD